jgi:dihydropteroate synthase
MPVDPVPLRVGRLLLEWGTRTYIMGIVNVTPDSFSGDGVMGVDAARARAQALVAGGADILDVGGESTRPGAHPVPLEEELARVLPVVEVLAAEFDASISVDTTNAEVARRALRAGAVMINDVSALQADPAMAAVVAEAQASVILMHGYRMAPPAAEESRRRDIMAEITGYLGARIEAAVAAGIRRDRVLVDPGFGFGKTVQENLDVLRRLAEVRSLGRPVVISTSRKGTIGRVLGGLPVQERVEGTAATVAVSIVHGADVVRVHDVAAMARVARMTDAIIRGRYQERV